MSTINPKNYLYVAICSVGIAVEYFDFIIFALLAPYIGINFFPSDNPNTQLLEVFMVFAIGYVVRPISGVVLGVLSDIYGRKNALMISILCMAFATFSIGILPNYSSIGILAPIILVILRVVQGITHGAEMPIAITYISELNIKHKEFSCSLLYTFASFGAICSLLFCYYLENIMVESEIVQWGWRLPFMSGGVLAVIGVLFRLYAVETPEFKNLQTSNKKITYIDLVNNIKNILTGMLVTFPVALLVILGLFMPTMMYKFLAFDKETAFEISLIGMCYYTFILPTLGYFYNAHYKYIIYRVTAFCYILLVLYLLAFNLHGYIPVLLFILTFKTVLASFGATYPMILARLFNSKYRNTAVAIGYNLAFSMAAFMPSICLHLANSITSLLVILSIIFIGFSAIGVIAIHMAIKSRVR